MIINKGKLVATDTMENLSSRLHGAETVAVEVLAARRNVVSRMGAQRSREAGEGGGREPRDRERLQRDSRARFTVEV
jgi:hypothetical protein